MGSLAPRPFAHGAVLGSVGLAGAIGACHRCWWQVGGSSRALPQEAVPANASLVAAGAVLPRAGAFGGLR
ncbi:putative lipoprotein [Thermomicrobium roseum DSM 5159]|uniref:Putative lipoprotein n=1 Tax=Thermomicrobium roseum (strain ATCC 27502 / DSM 5159 / P-2) TaxID=309801 RepID=B9L082_THERP|nr:putative lipoprotein [Thermomicrobium roseum DSM 5159]